QSPSSQDDSSSQNLVINFQSNLAVIIGILCIMFSLTFILLIYAKFCQRTSSVHNNRLNQDGLVGSRSRFSGIDKTVIESLPFFRFSSLRGSRECLECAVCLSKFEDIEILRLLPKCKHAFHIDCVDQWLEKHSSCPLCRQKVSADDLSFLTYSNSLRFLWNKSELQEDSNLELFVQREEEDHHGSSRFSVGSSFRKSEKRKKEEEMPIHDDNDQKVHCKYNHKIIVSDVFQKNRWSSVSSSDLMFLSSNMLNVMSSNRFSSTARGIEDGQIMKIKEGMEKKMVQSECDSLPFSCLPSTSESNLNPSSTSKLLNPNEKRSMSEIIVHPRFTEFSMKNRITDSPLPENNAEEERMGRLWLPIARRTVQWFVNREKRSQQSQNTNHSMNV
ncbi:hypothetical protein F0562_029842, partial [Nyssa sinensis]